MYLLRTAASYQTCCIMSTHAHLPAAPPLSLAAATTHRKACDPEQRDALLPGAVERRLVAGAAAHARYTRRAHPLVAAQVRQPHHRLAVCLAAAVDAAGAGAAAAGPRVKFELCPCPCKRERPGRETIRESTCACHAHTQVVGLTGLQAGSQGHAAFRSPLPASCRAPGLAPRHPHF